MELVHTTPANVWVFRGFDLKAKVFPPDLKAEGYGVVVEFKNVKANDFTAARRLVIEFMRDKYKVSAVSVLDEDGKDWTTFDTW